MEVNVPAEGGAGLVLLLFGKWGEGKIRHAESSSVIILLQKDCQKIDRVNVQTEHAGVMGLDIH